MLPRIEPRNWYRIENAASQEAADIYIFDEISYFGVTANDFVRELSGITSPAINLHLNTPGGDVFDGIAIFNALKSHPATVNAFIPGIAASIGTVIAMAADNIAIAPHARMMIHEAWGLSMGNADDMAKMAERLEATSQNIASIYAERAGQDVDYWRDLMRAETWYTDQGAVDVGLADEVARAGDKNALKQAAAFDLSTYRHGEREAARLRAEVPPDEPEPTEDEEVPAPPPDEPESTSDDAEEPVAPAPGDWLVEVAARLAEERTALEAELFGAGIRS